MGEEAKTRRAFQSIEGTGAQALILLQEVNTMAEEKEIVKGQHHRKSLLLCDPDQVSRKSEEMLKMHDIRLLPFQDL